VQWYLRRANRQLLSIYCISRYIQNNRRPLHRSIYIIWFIINKLAFPVWEKFSLLQKKVIISIMWKIISYLPSFQDNRLHLKRIKQKICLFSLYSTFFCLSNWYLIKSYVHLFKSVEQKRISMLISASIMRNRVHMVSSIIFPSRHLFFQDALLVFFSSHHISYELSNKCRFPRSIEHILFFFFFLFD